MHTLTSTGECLTASCNKCVLYLELCSDYTQTSAVSYARGDCMWWLYVVTVLSYVVTVRGDCTELRGDCTWWLYWVTWWLYVVTVRGDCTWWLHWVTWWLYVVTALSYVVTVLSYLVAGHKPVHCKQHVWLWKPWLVLFLENVFHYNVTQQFLEFAMNLI